MLLRKDSLQAAVAALPGRNGRSWGVRLLAEGVMKVGTGFGAKAITSAAAGYYKKAGLFESEL